jgi:hypothetical protein
MEPRRIAALAMAAAFLLAGCDGGDATPTAPAGDEVPADEDVEGDPGQHDPGDRLEEPDPDEAPPDAEPDVDD